MKKKPAQITAAGVAGSPAKKVSRAALAAAAGGAILLTASDANMIPHPDASSTKLLGHSIVSPTFAGDIAESMDQGHIVPTWVLAHAYFKTPEEQRPVALRAANPIVTVMHEGKPVTCRIETEGKGKKQIVRMIILADQHMVNKGDTLLMLV